jgi:hypothetical protein
MVLHEQSILEEKAAKRLQLEKTPQANQQESCIEFMFASLHHNKDISARKPA